MFRFALLGTISVVLLLAAASFASAGGVSYMHGDSGHTLNATTHMGWNNSGDTTTTGDVASMPRSVEAMATNMENAAVQMREHAARMEATNHMQQSTEMDPGYGMQYGNMETGTVYMDTNNMEYGSGYMDSGNTGDMGSPTNSGTMGSSTGSGSHMGTIGTGGTGTTHTSGSSSMMGR